MKKIAIILLTAVLFSFSQKPHYTINGVFKDGVGKQLVLKELSNQTVIKVIDSARVDANGNFTFRGASFGEIKEARISIVGAKPKIDLLLEEATTNITIVTDSVTRPNRDWPYHFSVERSKEDAVYAYLKDNYLQRRRVWGLATSKVVSNNDNKLNDEEIVKARAKLDTEFVEEIIDTLSNYPDNYGTYFYIKNYMLRFDPLPSVEKAFNNLSERIKGSKEAMVYKTEVDEIKRSFVGGTPENFSIPSLDGGEITLHQYRGKVLFIDCWASWCGPCIKAMPGVGELYKKFNPQGLEVLGISYDKDEDDWHDFLKKNEYITWDQASSLKEWQCPSSKKLTVTFLPTTILIDKKGVIAARNLHGEELEAKIKELLALN